MKLWNWYWDQGCVWETSILGRNTNSVNVSIWNKAKMSNTWVLWSRSTQSYFLKLPRDVSSPNLLCLLLPVRREKQPPFTRSPSNTRKWPHPMFLPLGTLKSPLSSFNSLQVFGTSWSPLKFSKSSTSDLTSPHWPLPAQPTTAKIRASQALVWIISNNLVRASPIHNVIYLFVYLFILFNSLSWNWVQETKIVIAIALWGLEGAAALRDRARETRKERTSGEKIGSVTLKAGQEYYKECTKYMNLLTGN